MGIAIVLAKSQFAGSSLGREQLVETEQRLKDLQDTAKTALAQLNKYREELEPLHEEILEHESDVCDLLHNLAEQFLALRQFKRREELFTDSMSFTDHGNVMSDVFQQYKQLPLEEKADALFLQQLGPLIKRYDALDESHFKAHNERWDRFEALATQYDDVEDTYLKAVDELNRLSSQNEADQRVVEAEAAMHPHL